MTEQTKTPETDAVDRSNYISTDGWEALRNHARRLERERDGLRTENERLRTIIPGQVERLNDELCDENDLLRAERDTAREALRKVTTLLRRYRTETPIGHQPHMIAHEVDAVLDGKS